MQISHMLWFGMVWCPQNSLQNRGVGSTNPFYKMGWSFVFNRFDGKDAFSTKRVMDQGSCHVVMGHGCRVPWCRGRVVLRVVWSCRVTLQIAAHLTSTHLILHYKTKKYSSVAHNTSQLTYPAGIPPYCPGSGGDQPDIWWRNCWSKDATWLLSAVFWIAIFWVIWHINSFFFHFVW